MTVHRDLKPAFSAARLTVRRVASGARTELTPLRAAHDRITSEPLFARVDHPRFDCSAMDGFVVPDVGAASFPLDLPIGTDLPAGGKDGALLEGQARPISTGAGVPPDAWTVITREAATVVAGEDGPVLRLIGPPSEGKNIRRAGEDARAAECVAPSGMHVTAVIIGALAAFGIAEVPTIAPPTFAILKTGNELVDVGDIPSAGQIFDSNGPMIEAMLEQAGLTALCTDACRDDDRDTYRAIRRQLDSGADILLSTGGVSGGQHDRVPAILRGLGADVHFHGVRMRPGKPLLFASFPSGQIYFGLPGNPVAAAAAFRFFVVEAVRARVGLPMEEGVPVSIDHPGRPGSTTILRGRRTSALHTPLTVAILPDQQSHRMRPMLKADHWVVVDAEDAGSTSRAFPMNGKYSCETGG